jgi:hypothetical protein
MPAASPGPNQRVHAWMGAAAALAAWTALIVVAHVWGAGIVEREPRTRISAAPLVARFDPRVHVAILVPVVVGALAVVFAWRLTAGLTWRRLLLVAFLAAAAWAVSLAAIDGVSALTRPLLAPSDYLRDVARVGDPHAFLSGFVDRLGTYHQHVRAHPPGMVLLLSAIDRAGLGGPGSEAALEILAGAAMVPAALIALREVAGEPKARTAAPFLAFAPVAVWVATSGDALFAGVTAWAIALIVVAIRRRGRAADLSALAGGLLFGVALTLSYGVAALVVVPTVVAVAFRRVRPLVVAAAGAAAVLLGLAAAGFWWPSGLSATAAQYRASVARFRPQSYFWFGDIAAFAIALGPATAAGLALLRDRRTWLLVAGALIAVALADASGFSKAEVERIWLPFAPWVLLACSALVEQGGALDATRSRAWLALVIATGLVLQVLLLTPW